MTLDRTLAHLQAWAQGCERTIAPIPGVRPLEEPVLAPQPMANAPST